MRRLVKIAALAGALVAGAMAGSALASNSHNTTGTGGSHSSGSHGLNPGHVWVIAGSPGAGAITSGGRYHDACGSRAGCYPGIDSANDWALDVGLGASAANYLDLAYGGWGSGGVTPDNNRAIKFEAIAGPVLNFRSPARAACYWQRFDIVATYWDTAGVKYTDVLVGKIWFAHLKNWVYGSGARVFAQGTSSNPYGSGTVSTIRLLRIGDVYDFGDSPPPGDTKCSDGPHFHVEAYSTHAWGFEYEWHSTSGPDGYWGLSGYTDHTHTSYPYSNDTVTSGQDLGAFGGATTLFWMRDNPVRSDY